MTTHWWCAVLIGIVINAGVSAAPKKSNVLMLAADDLRPQLGCYNPLHSAGKHVAIQTPNIDRLASEGMVFLNAYCQAALCGPSRSSLLTGRRPDTTHVRTIGPYWRTVGGNFTSLPEHFRLNGYSTHGLGKIFHPGSTSGGTNSAGYVNPGIDAPWVIGDDYPHAWTLNDPEIPPYFHAPNKLFWQCSAAPGYNTTCPPPGGMGRRITPSMLTVNTSLEREVPLMDEQLATQAIKTLAILKARAEPWFVAVGFHLPHLPELVPERFVEQYQSAELPDNQFAPYKMPLVAWSHSGELLGQYSDARALHASGAINSTLPEKYAKGLRQHYYGAVSYIDFQVGRVLSALEENGQASNTIKILWGDHGYQLGEHGIWGKITNFELAVHTALIISWPGMSSRRRRWHGHQQYSKSFVEFVDIFPTLSDLAGIPLPPLCPKNSTLVKLCTEGISLRPIIESASGAAAAAAADGGVEVKRAAFSQYWHPGGGALRSATAAKTKPLATIAVAAAAAASSCPASVVGQWYALEKGDPDKLDVFVFKAESSKGGVTMDISGCSDCGFTRAAGNLTETGVDLIITFNPSTKLQPKHQVGTFEDGGCSMTWTTNSTDGSGHWVTFYRSRPLPPSPSPSPPPPPPSSYLYMGYTMVTRAALQGELSDGGGGGGVVHEYRYTEWPRWIGGSEDDACSADCVDWTDIAGRELYNHTADLEENVNVLDSSPASLVANLSRQLRAGWRGALIEDGRDRSE